MYEIDENEIANQTQLYINNQFTSISSRLGGESKFLLQDTCCKTQILEEIQLNYNYQVIHDFVNKFSI